MHRQCMRLDAHLRHTHVTTDGVGEAMMYTQWWCPGLDVATERAIEVFSDAGFDVTPIDPTEGK